MQYLNLTLLQFAVTNDRYEIVKFLLTQKKVMKTIDEKSCLFEFAISNNNIEMAEFLLQYMQSKSIGQYSILYLPVPHVQIKWGQFKLTIDDANDNQNFQNYISNFTQFFLRKSENENIEKIKLQLGKKYTALFACFAAYILDEKEFIEFFEKYELNINAVEKNTKLTPLISSMFNRNYDILKVILSKYKDTIDVHCKTNQDIVPIHILCFRSQLSREGEKMLLTFKNLDKNAKIDSYSPLHLAVLNDNLELVSFLLNDKDVNINAENSIYQTPFHLIFRSYKCLDMLKLFYNFSSQSFNLMKRDRKVFIYYFPIFLYFRKKLLSSFFMALKHANYIIKMLIILLNQYICPFSNYMFNFE